MQIARYAVVAYFVCVAAIMTPSAAQEAAPRRASQGLIGFTVDGILLDEIIRIRVRDMHFRVPAGFLAPWPRPKMQKVVNERLAVGFNFWMPERRHVEIDDTYLSGFRPTELGRSYDPASSLFVVKVRGISSRKLTEPGFVPLETQFKNYTSYGTYSFQEEFGLVRFWRNDGPHAGFHYKHIDGSDPHVMVRCSPVRADSGESLCQLSVHFVAEELYGSIEMSRRDLPRWRESVQAAFDLFKSWRVAAQ